jgi:hypothetical protein
MFMGTGAHIEVSNIHVTGSHRSWPDVPMTVLQVALPKSPGSHGILPMPQATFGVVFEPGTVSCPPPLPASAAELAAEPVAGSSVERLPEQAETNSSAIADQESG